MIIIRQVTSVFFFFSLFFQKMLNIFKINNQVGMNILLWKFLELLNVENERQHRF